MTGDLDYAGIERHVGKRLPARHDLIRRTREAVYVLVRSLCHYYISRFFELLRRFVGCRRRDRYSTGWREDIFNDGAIDTSVC